VKVNQLTSQTHAANVSAYQMVEVTVHGRKYLMREWTPRAHLEEAFRQELFGLIDQYIRFPDDATLGKINRTLATFQQVVMSLESSFGTLVERPNIVERRARPGSAAKSKSSNCAARLGNGIFNDGSGFAMESEPVCPAKILHSTKSKQRKLVP
jgi:hypothetical protein